MKLTELMHSIEKSASNTTGHFLLSLQGVILVCNGYGARLFKFASPTQLIGRHLNDLVPEEFASHLPEEITEEHLTNGQFLERVNVCADGELIPTLVKTQRVRVDDLQLIECFIRLNEAADEPIKALRYRQTADLLKCEVMRLKRQVSQSKIQALIDQRLVKAACRLQIPFTQGDLLFCSLLTSGLSTKEIAEQLNITLASAYKQRKRIRKKLSLPVETNLYHYLISIID
ncbi:PAS domain-containing protein [Carboxylicivirga taeanensis]|uniref:PAS domain-containing protein n=1 Tax=Carboxylicivirga taeanensis TaxID=1416875 RepID=UPI003F6E00A4